MACDDFVELVTANLDGDLDPATALRFVAHLVECVGRDRYLDQIRRTIAELGHLPARRLPPEVRGSLLTAFRNWPTGQGRARSSSRNAELN